MNFFRWFRGNTQPEQPLGKPPEAVIRILERQKAVMRGQQLTNEALSHQNLGNGAKALSLLEQAISGCQYAPAMTIKAKMLIAAEQNAEADKWLRNCLGRLADTSNTSLDMFCREGLRAEMYEQLGIIQFKWYGNFPEALKFFQRGLDTIDQSERAIAAWMGSAPASLRSSIYAELAYLYALEGTPELAIRFSKERLNTSPDCESCKQILNLMDGFEQRPHNLEDVVDVLVKKLVTLRHPQALAMNDPPPASVIRESIVPMAASQLRRSIVPLAFAWICMRHKVKPHNFLSGPEVSLLTQRAILAMAGWDRLANNEVAKQLRQLVPHYDQMRKAGFGQGRDSNAITTDCMNRLSSIMRCIPVDDLFDANDHAMLCLAGWCEGELKLSRAQSLDLVSSLPRTR
jgi:tetratricopeptide (TPR) repeat protein